jgi:alkylated DNA repair protein (DNA oxidative demethylase)
MTAPSVAPTSKSRGLRYYPGYLDRLGQQALAEDILSAINDAPFFTPVMPRTGRPFTVRMTNMGPLGWVSDRAGYRYQPTHPESGRPWPPIPDRVLAIWRAVADYAHDPQACLVNWYREGAKMGLHRDEDEVDFAAPVVSISLGDTAIFRIGGTERSGSTETLKLSSGDVLVLGGESRLRYHGIDRVLTGTSRLLAESGRINLTLRRVAKPQSSPLA